MAFSRYNNRRTFVNNDREYKKTFLEQRDANYIRQFDLARLYYPSDAMISQIDTVTAIWTATDKLYNIAAEYYGSPAYWWIIAWFNQKTAESDFQAGEVYLIPLSLEEMLGYF